MAIVTTYVCDICGKRDERRDSTCSAIRAFDLRLCDGYVGSGSFLMGLFRGEACQECRDALAEAANVGVLGGIAARKARR